MVCNARGDRKSPMPFSRGKLYVGRVCTSRVRERETGALRSLVAVLREPTTLATRLVDARAARIFAFATGRIEWKGSHVFARLGPQLKTFRSLRSPWLLRKLHRSPLLLLRYGIGVLLRVLASKLSKLVSDSVFISTDLLAPRWK